MQSGSHAYLFSSSNLTKILNFHSAELLYVVLVDSVSASVECSSAPVEPDRWEGFEKLAKTSRKRLVHCSEGGR